MTDEHGTFAELHAIWDADHPEQAAYAQEIESIRRARWMETHDDSDAGYVPARLFPCRGAMRSEVGDVWTTLTCDVCGYEVAVRAETAPVSSTEMEW